MKKTIKGIVYIVIFLLISFIVIESFIILEGSKTHEEEVDYLFILGAKLYGDRPSPALLERLKIGKDYLDRYKDVKVVVSGGKGNDESISEARVMHDYLVNKGIDQSRIIIEENSTNTFQNIKYGLELVKEIDDREDIEIIIATNRFHILRSKLIARRAGAIGYGLPAKVPPTTIVQAYAREYFALIKTFIFDK